jgi:hypothetical protein
VKSKQCPSPAELLAFADADLSPEQLQRVEAHLEVCSACAQEVMALTQLIGDIAAPLGAAELDVQQHVAAVLQRLDVPAKPWWSEHKAAWGGVLAALAAAAALLLFVGGDPQADGGEFRARGAASEPSLSRDVGLQVYAQAPSLRALKDGGSIRAGTPLTAGLRNVAQTPAYLLLFAVDSEHVVHWIAPQFTTPGSDPRALSIAPQPEEKLLPTSAVFDDLAPGPLRIVALISADPQHVSAIEALGPGELASSKLEQRFPRAEVRQIVLEVTR